VLDQEVGLAKEAKLQEENGTVNMKSRGLGDSIHKFTTATGIKTIVDKVSKGLNIPCGCEGRRQALNNLVPYNKQFKLKK
jgi:hypothetical protein